MKYNIFDYNQKKAVELGLDLKDLLILNWIQTFYPKMHKTIRDDKQYFWVKYSAVLQDIPILEIDSEKGLYKRMKKMCEIGILEYLPIRTAGGCFSYYLITEMMADLVSSHSPQSYPEKPESYPQSPQSSYAIINSSTINSSTINSKQKTNKKEIPVVKESLTTQSVEVEVAEIDCKQNIDLFEAFWKKYPRKKAKEKARQIFEKLLSKEKNKEILAEKIMKGLELYNQEIMQKQTKEEFIAHATTWLNQARWEDEYEPITHTTNKQNKINLSKSYEHRTQDNANKPHTNKDIYYGTHPDNIGIVSADDFKVKKPSTDKSES